MHRLSPKERAFAIKYLQLDLQALDGAEDKALEWD